MKPPSAGLFATAATLAVLAAVVAGLVASGSPGHVRLQRLDAARAMNLQAISNLVASHYRAHGSVPTSLAELAGNPGWLDQQLRDPVSRAAYDYRAIDSVSYEICARFDTESTMARTQAVTPQNFSVHGAGRQCFTGHVP
jgi:hypothetical protein